MPRVLNEFMGNTPAAATSPATYNANFSALYPNLSDTQAQVSSNTLARLRGELSPETLNAIQDTAARFGIGTGMPLGSGGNTVTGNFGRKLLGQTTEGLQSQGLQDYLNTLGGYSGTLMPSPGDVIGAETSRYGIDVGARTAGNAQDLERWKAQLDAMFRAQELGLQGQQISGNLGLGYANLGQNYLNSYLNFLN